MKLKTFSATKFIYFLLFLFFLFVVGCVILKSGKPMIWTGSLLVMAGYLFVIEKAEKGKAFFEKYYYLILAAFLIVMAITQIPRIETLRYIPSFDLDAIYGGAIQWAETGTFANYYDYYDWFPNNLGGLCTLYTLLRLFGWITDDYFMIAAVANEIFILLTYAVISLSVKKLYGELYGVLALIVCAFILPFHIMAAAFYTDSLSMLFPVLLFYLYLQQKDSKGKKSWVWAVLFALAATLGIFIKATVAIMVVAVGIALLLFKRWRSFLKIFLCFAGIYFLFTLCFHQYIYTNHLDPEAARIKNTPYTHWIMMGLQGEGGYNPGDYEFTRSFADPEARDEALKEVIGSRVSEKGISGMLSLYAAKMNHDLGEGTLGVSDFLDDSPQNENGLHDYVLYSGRYYGTWQTVCRIFFFALLLLLLLSPLLSWMQRSGNKDELVPLLSVCGILFFLMNWETSSRYITNFVPVIAVAAVGSCRKLYAFLKEHEIYKKGAAFKQRHQTEIKVVLMACSFRLFVYILLVCIMAIMGEYTEGITFSDFLEACKRWDSSHYLNIAENGYAGAIENGEHIFLVFFPLYPWLIKTVGIIAGETRLAGVFISTICYSIGCLYFYKLTEKEWNKEAAKYGLILISVFPFAFFFGSIATESLFFAITMMFLYYLRKHRWNMVALLGMLACLTKVQGVLLAFAVLTELFYFKRGFTLLKRKKWKSFGRRILGPGILSATMLSGILVYMMINYAVEGDPLRFLYYQKNHWGNGLAPIWVTLRYIINYVKNDWHTSTGMALWVPELVLFFLYLVIIAYGWKKKMRPMYMVYLVSFFLLTYSSTWLISAGRYTLSAFPAFMLGGKFLAEHEKARIPVIVISAMLFAVYFVGYFMWKQIM